jgi:hypothetical protein
LGEPPIDEVLRALGLGKSGQRLVGGATGAAFFGAFDARRCAYEHQALDLFGVRQGDVKRYAPSHRIAHPDGWPAHGLVEKVSRAP